MVITRTRRNNMFHLANEKLEQLGTLITTREIEYQPSLWKEAFQLYLDAFNDISDFLSGIYQKHNFIDVIFTGAGTSEFVGQSISNYLNQANDLKKLRFSSVGSIELVARPMDYLQEDVPTILVSFARSGNSPESLAAIENAKKLVRDLYQISITCAPDGKLALAAREEENHLLLLQPAGSNDKGFAMTGSYTCMSLTALLVFSPESQTVKEKWVDTISKLGQDILNRVDSIKDIVDLDFSRVIYLGSGGLYGVAREAQLKLLELTAGHIATMFETPLGFRHGPKSFINDETLVIHFTSNDSYTKQYDIDLLREVATDQIAKKVIALSSEKIPVNLENVTLSDGSKELPDVFLTFPYIIFGQVFATMTALKLGNKPDTPSPTGTVNRVVQGVTIYPLSV